MKPTAEKLKENAPYNLFFTTISNSPETFSQKNAITFSDLLCPSLGELKCSLQLNFVVDIEWVMQQYEKMGQGEKPLTILYGSESDLSQKHGEECRTTEKYIVRKLPNVKGHYVKPASLYGIHQSKMSIYVYNDNSLRVVVSTANLYSLDWEIYCNGLWISPLCPVLPKNCRDTTGAGASHFKPTLLAYLDQYKEPVLEEWIGYLRRADFSAVKVCLITSTPGLHKVNQWPVHCHRHRIGKLLSLHCKLPDEASLVRHEKANNDGPSSREEEGTTAMEKINPDNQKASTSQKTNTEDETTPTYDEGASWEILAQVSTVGFLKNSADDWLSIALIESLTRHTRYRLPVKSHARFKIVYPSKSDVLNSYYGSSGGGCLNYWMDFTQEDQMWPRQYLHSWNAAETHRSRAMPHIKTYCRVSPCKTELAWFLLTSANISKSAWGSSTNQDGSIYVRSFEVGVLFLPKYFNEDYFQIKENDANKTAKLFPFMYDLPLTPYGAEDEAWTNLKRETGA